jgi:soluble lytic murein transglycosylase
MSTHHSAQAFRFGLLVHANKIWISEFLGIIFVSTVLLTFFMLTFLVLLDEGLILSNDRRILALKSDKTIMVKDLGELSSKAKIVDAMRMVLGTRLPAQAYGQLADLIHKNSTAFGYDPLLLLAVIEVESKFRAGASGQYKSGEASGAIGLMQLKFETAQEIAKSLGMSVTTIHDLFRPDINVPLGVAYLTQLISKFHSFKLGLLAYNQGPGVILGQLATQQPLSIDYYNRVLQSYYEFRAITDSLGIAGD